MSSDLQSIRQAVQAKVDALHQMMAAQSLSDRIEVSHEFVQHSPAALQQIQDAADTLAKLPKSAPLFAKSAVTVASALSSAGKLAEAQSLLVDARHSSSVAEGALIAYNLFQVRTRLGAYDDAMDIMNSAIRADAAVYGLHDTKKYPPLRMMGAGSMGCLFQCENAAGGKPVALKTLWEPNRQAGEAIFDEAKQLQQVQHDGILAPQDFGFSDPANADKPYFTYQRVPGAVSGEKWLEKNGPMGHDQALQVGSKLLEILAHAHAAGICHLNLSPSNVLLKRMGPNLDVKITDWGLSRATVCLKQRVLQTADQKGNSEFGRVLNHGLDYLAPEQTGALQYGSPGIPADLYAWAATMYRLMTGDQPRNMSEDKMAEHPEYYRILSTMRREDPSTRTESLQELAGWWQNPQILADLQVAQREAAKEAEMVALGGVRKEPEEVEEKSKLPLFIGIGVGVVVVAAIVGFVLFGGDKGDKKGKTTTAKKAKPAVSDKEMERLEKWYKGARAAVNNVLAPTCGPLHDAGYQYESHLVPVMMKKANKRGKISSYRVFKLELKPKGSAAGKLDIFDCPGRLAQIHHDHTYTIDMRFSSSQASMFSRRVQHGTVKITGKMTGYLTKTKFGTALLYRRGLSLPGVRKSDDPGISKLGKHNRAHIKGRSLHVANLEFKRQGGGKKAYGILGRWKAELRTGKYKKDMNDWATGCKTGLNEALGKLVEVRAKDKVHGRLANAVKDWSVGFCKALVDLNNSVEPWSGPGVGKAVGALLKAKKDWNTNIFQPLKKTAESVETTLKTKGF